MIRLYRLRVTSLTDRSVLEVDERARSVGEALELADQVAALHMADAGGIVLEADPRVLIQERS